MKNKGEATPPTLLLFSGLSLTYMHPTLSTYDSWNRIDTATYTRCVRDVSGSLSAARDTASDVKDSWFFFPSLCPCLAIITCAMFGHTWPYCNYVRRGNYLAQPDKPEGRGEKSPVPPRPIMSPSLSPPPHSYPKLCLSAKFHPSPPVAPSLARRRRRRHCVTLRDTASVLNYRTYS